MCSDLTIRMGYSLKIDTKRDTCCIDNNNIFRETKEHDLSLKHVMEVEAAGNLELNVYNAIVVYEITV